VIFETAIAESGFITLGITKQHTLNDEITVYRIRPLDTIKILESHINIEFIYLI
jgi:hypothetical protein